MRPRRMSGVSPTVSRIESLMSGAVPVVVVMLCAGGCGRLVPGLAARKLGLLDLALGDELRQRVVRDGARDLRHVGDRGRGHARALGDGGEDLGAVGAARRARAGG